LASIEIIIASRNRGKIGEIRDILSLEGVPVFDLIQLGFEEPIEEVGSSFLENALIKARTVYRRYQKPVIADDSGLVVPRLNGEPGVRSARYAGPGADDRRNNELLLEKLGEARGEGRRAWFVCTAVFLYDEEKYRVAEGRVDGTIGLEPRGRGGFGYDPLFYLPHFGKTMAQLTEGQKNEISHRGAAFRSLKTDIQAFFAGGGSAP
jgi:XTP/dITP diphosphohydrolase